MFKVGDVVERITGHYKGMKKGDRAKITHVRLLDESLELEGYGSGHAQYSFKLAETEGPVITTIIPATTVTKIVPGVYDKVRTGLVKGGQLALAMPDTWYTADELEAAAATLTVLAKGLRDIQNAGTK